MAEFTISLDGEFVVSIDREGDDWLAHSTMSPAYGRGAFPLEALRCFIEALEDRYSVLMAVDPVSIGEALRQEASELGRWYGEGIDA